MQPIVVGDLTIYYNERRVVLHGTNIKLTDKEWDILECLGLCAGSMVTRRMLNAVAHRYGGIPSSDTQVNVTVCRVRKKLSAASHGKEYIDVVRHDGYVLRPPDAA